MDRSPFDALFQKHQESNQHPSQSEEDVLDMFFGGQQQPRRRSSSSIRHHVNEQETNLLVDVDLPGVSAKYLDVHVQEHHDACQVTWRTGGTTESSGRAQSTQHRFHKDAIRLRSVDCSQLAANLSRGVLRLTVPLVKEKPKEPPQEVRRNIPIRNKSRN